MQYFRIIIILSIALGFIKGILATRGGIILIGVVIWLIYNGTIKIPTGSFLNGEKKDPLTGKLNVKGERPKTSYTVPDDFEIYKSKFMRFMNNMFSTKLKVKANNAKTIWDLDPSRKLNIYVDYSLKGRKRIIKVFDSDENFSSNIIFVFNKEQFNAFINKIYYEDISKLIEKYNGKIDSQTF